MQALSTAPDLFAFATIGQAHIVILLAIAAASAFATIVSKY